MRITGIALSIILVVLVLADQIMTNSHHSKDVIDYTMLPEHNHEEAVEAVSSIEDYGLEIGQKAPDFTLETLTGEKLTLQDFKGKKILLNFWASWCGPCKQEMPAMQKVYEQMKEEQIEIIAVNLTFGEENSNDAKSFADEYKLTFPIPLDINGEVQEKYQIYPIPTSYFIDEAGIIRSKYIGPMDENYMIHEFNNL